MTKRKRQDEALSTVICWQMIVKCSLVVKDLLRTKVLLPTEQDGDIFPFKTFQVSIINLICE